MTMSFAKASLCNFPCVKGCVILFLNCFGCWHFDLGCYLFPLFSSYPKMRKQRILFIFDDTFIIRPLPVWITPGPCCLLRNSLLFKSFKLLTSETMSILNTRNSASLSYKVKMPTKVLTICGGMAPPPQWRYERYSKLIFKIQNPMKINASGPLKGKKHVLK